MESIAGALQPLQGFKMADSHFRIGSKIHIDSFYYAKRFFQNNFFASRFAFLLTEQILQTFDNTQWERIREKGLSLIGYGLYSELLIALVEKFLKAHGKAGLKVNHNVVLDSEELTLIKKEPLFYYGIIIVPIASTFSTALKMEVALQSTACSILSPHFNLLFISDEGYLASTEPTPLEQEFGWIVKDPPTKRVVVTSFLADKEQNREQQYLFHLTTKWWKVDQCEACFPSGHKDSLLAEKPLFETDQTAVTPAVIFDFPRGRRLSTEERSRKFLLTPAMFHYGHQLRNNNHSIFSIDTEAFLAQNKDVVTEWLKSLKKEGWFVRQFQATSHILIVSSCHFSNAAFIHQVNETLFASAANIIHYDPFNDYIQNFEIIYGREVKAADHIIFVDDSLKSGETFIKIDEFVRYTLRTMPGEANAKTDGIATCLFLFNKTQPFAFNRVKERLIGERTIEAYAHLHLFSALSPDATSPLVFEEKRYQKLVDDSFLDSLQLHFIEQSLKLGIGKHVDGSDLKKERHLHMLIATHCVYHYFSEPRSSFSSLLTFSDFFQALQADVISPVRYAFRFQTPSSRFSVFEACLLKVLTQFPFTQYEPLRKMVFGWMLHLVDEMRIGVLEKITAAQFSYQDFEDFKFIIRRAGLLNSNYLISIKMFACLRSFYGVPNWTLMEEAIIAEVQELNKEENKEKKRGELEEGEKRLKNIRDFPVFFVAQIKELLLLNEARSIRLEKLLRNKPFLRKGSRPYEQVIRVLQEENTIIIKKFYEFLRSQPEWLTLYQKQKGAIDHQLIPLLNLLIQPNIQKHHRYGALKDFFEMTGQRSPDDNGAFQEYLWIQYYLATERYKSFLTLTEKTEDLLTHLMNICTQSDESGGSNTTETGAFLIVKDQQKATFLAYNKNAQGSPELDPVQWKTDEYNYLQTFLNGDIDHSQTYFKTIIELRRDKITNEWKSLYSIKEGPAIAGLSPQFLPSRINHLILMRLSKRNADRSEKCMGVIGFYFHKNASLPTDINRIRYLLLLRGPLSGFIEKHHQSSEFRDWLFAENAKNLGLLAGHGKDMLRDLSQSDESFQQVALNLEHLQLIILLDKNIERHGAVPNIQRTFNQFYHVGGNALITTVYKEKLQNLAQKIYDSPAVENVVECTPVVSMETSFQFAFNENILNLICVELIINAKKNRWHFIDVGEEDVKISQNELQIFFEQCPQKDGERKMKVVIESTGPGMDWAYDTDVMSKLNNRNDNVKREEVTSGTALVKKLVWDILGGCVKFKCKQIDKTDVYRFSAILHLNEMK